MQTTSTADILIGMPVYEGWDHVEETLDSVLNQQFKRFRLLISIDGNDDRSRRICEPYRRDARVEMVVQSERLGWAGNINWLMLQLREPFFCYWQHDDPCDPSYLQELLDHARDHPEAACVYSDMRFMGEKVGEFRYESIRGFALQRVLQQIEQNLAVPLRGAIRREAIAQAGPIGLAYDGAKLETAWIAKLARHGELHRVPKPLYFKRSREGSSSWKWRAWPPERWRAVMLEWALEVLDAALPTAHPSDHTKLLAAIVDRMLIPRGKRHFYYDPLIEGPEGRVRLVGEFLARAEGRFGVVAFDQLRRAADPIAALRRRQLTHSGEEAELLIVSALLADLPSGSGQASSEDGSPKVDLVPAPAA